VKQQVKKWGNSLSIRIPKRVAEELHLQADSEVELSVRGSRLVIEPVVRPVYSLDELLPDISPENLHAEIDWGSDVGKEVW